MKTNDLQIDRSEFIDSVLDLLAELCEMERSEIQDSDRLRHDLGLDSLRSMDALSRITEKFRIDLELEEVLRIETVGDIVKQFDRRFGSALQQVRRR